MQVLLSGSQERASIRFGNENDRTPSSVHSAVAKNVARCALSRHTAKADSRDESRVAQELKEILAPGKKSTELTTDQLRVFGRALYDYADATATDITNISNSGLDSVEWTIAEQRWGHGDIARKLYEDVSEFQRENPDFAPQTQESQSA